VSWENTRPRKMCRHTPADKTRAFAIALGHCRPALDSRRSIGSRQAGTPRCRRHRYKRWRMCWFRPKRLRSCTSALGCWRCSASPLDGTRRRRRCQGRRSRNPLPQTRSRRSNTTETVSRSRTRSRPVGIRRHRRCRYTRKRTRPRVPKGHLLHTPAARLPRCTRRTRARTPLRPRNSAHRPRLPSTPLLRGSRLPRDRIRPVPVLPRRVQMAGALPPRPVPVARGRRHPSCHSARS